MLNHVTLICLLCVYSANIQKSPNPAFDPDATVSKTEEKTTPVMSSEETDGGKYEKETLKDEDGTLV